jgi:hypothetical protein
MDWVHVQNKHTLTLTLTLIDVRNTLIECDGALVLHINLILKFLILIGRCVSVNR